MIYTRCDRRWSRPRTLVAAGAAASMLTGCASLPSSGPTADQIVHAEHARHGFPFQIIDLGVARPSETGEGATGRLSLASLDRAEAADRIGAGDVLQIAIYEVGAAIFSSGPSAASLSRGMDTPPSATGTNLPVVSVEEDGSITLPYVGRLEVAGRTPSQVQQMIVDALKGKSQTPQAIVSIRDRISNTVVVIGEVKKPGRLPLSGQHDRVLDAVASTGGPNYPVQDMVVRVTRDGRSVSERLSDLAAASPDNIPLSPQDRIELIHRPETFIVLGAVTRAQEVAFQSPEVNLAEAISRAGGLNDQQADPSAVFVFRYSSLNADGSPSSEAHPVAYRLNLMRPESYFLAQKFQIHSNDIVYIANARSNQPSKLLQILNLFFSPIYTAKVVSQ